jgi:hypothetical protein
MDCNLAVQNLAKHHYVYLYSVLIHVTMLVCRRDLESSREERETLECDDYLAQM